jgi:TP901 family phage tail tape measure protein
MGFAGQIFAARVAVGLATPSPQALSDAGKTLATGVEAIYGKLNQKKVKAAKDREKAANEELSAAKSNLSKFRGDEASKLAKETSDQIAQVEFIGKRMKQAVQASTSGTGEVFGQLKTMIPKDVSKSLLAGTDKVMSSIDKAQKMGANYAKMTEGQRAKLHQGTVKNIQDKEAEIKGIDKLNKRNENFIKQMQKEQDQYEKNYEGKRGRNSHFLKEMKSYDEMIKTMKKENVERTEGIEKIQETIKVAKNEKQVIDDIKESYNASKKSIKDAGDVLEKKYSKAQKKAKDATKKTKDEIAAMSTRAKAMGQNIGKAATQISSGFNNALRDSIGVMTAFYYKLNQNTQELIAFERELINAGSVFEGTKDELFEAGEVVTQFGQRFGIEMQNGATGLYQLASAGLTVEESMKVLPETLKLSMAVQGDHNTIAKLTTQTIKGFGMEMDDAAIITDKFAYAIQKSLIEYEDLSSAVKFALPFFTSTGQSIDQLLGSLQILTNRALEAGIAGRGLRQALAEFAEGAEDNDRAFRKMGINILNAEGEMKQLNEIAADFAKVVGEDTVTNTELLTSLIDDLNVRGATAFVHLVQASDEFTEAVHNTANAGGELDMMVEKQNESLHSQIQILKNNVGMIFMLNDANYAGTGYLNGFHEAVHNAVATLKNLLVVEEEGTMVLTAFGQQIQDIATSGINLLVDVMKEAVVIVREFTDAGALNMDLLKLYAMPLKIVLDILNFIGPSGTKFLLYFSMLNKLLPVSTILQGIYNYKLLEATAASSALAIANEKEAAAKRAVVFADIGGVPAKNTNTAATWGQWLATNSLTTALWGAVTATYAFLAPWAPFIAIGLAVVGVFYILNKEFNILGRLMGMVKEGVKIFGEAWTEAYDVHIFPFLYTVGKEIVAFGAIVGFVISGIVQHIRNWIADNGMIVQTLKFVFDIIWTIGQVAIAYVVYKVKQWYNLFETVFDIIGEIYAFVTGEQTVWETVENIVGHIKDYFVQWWENIDEAISSVDALAGPWDTFKSGVKDVLDYFIDMYNKVKDIVDIMPSVEGSSFAAGAETSYLAGEEGYIPDLGLTGNKDTSYWKGEEGLLPDYGIFGANGMYVRGMATGGPMGTRRPYIVGEKGPELFMPNNSGQVINNRRTLDMLGRSMEGGPALNGQPQKIEVKNLEVSSAKLKGTRMAIDSFAGVI